MRLLAVLLIAVQAVTGSEHVSEPINQVTIAPLFYLPFACMDHPEGQLSDLGDAVGTDCMVVGGFKGAAGYMRFFRTDGLRNEDWYGWRAEVHAPFDGEVTAVSLNPVTNEPGSMGKPPASYVQFRRGDGTVVVYAHVQDVRVKVGDHVSSGDVVAVDGNNGTARAPHIHVGAYRGKEPLQVRWDLRAEGRVATLLGR